MKRFVEGESLAQSTLFPERSEEYIAEDNPVRVVDVFVDALVAIDGSKFKDVNGRDRNFAKHKLKARMQQLEMGSTHFLMSRLPTAWVNSRLASISRRRIPSGLPNEARRGQTQRTSCKIM